MPGKSMTGVRSYIDAFALRQDLTLFLMGEIMNEAKKPARILVVDDEDRNRRLLVAVLAAFKGCFGRFRDIFEAHRASFEARGCVPLA